MKIHNLFLLLALGILIVSTKAKSDECIQGNNFLLPAGDSYTLYQDLSLQGYNDELTVCVTHNYGAPVRVEASNGQELFTLQENSVCDLYQDLHTVKAICEGAGDNDCNINWNICGQSSEFTIPDPPTTRPTPIGGLTRGEKDDEGSGFVVGYIYANPETTESGLVKDSSRPNDIIVDRCPEGTVLTIFEMPVYDEQGLFVVDYERVYYCIDEDLEPAR